MAKVCSPLLHLTLEGECVRVLAAEEVQNGSVVVQNVHRVLVIAPNSQMGMPADCAFCGGEVSSHQLQQCGLPRAIGTDQCNPAVTVNAKLQTLQRGQGCQPILRITSSNVERLCLTVFTWLVETCQLAC